MPNFIWVYEPIQVMTTGFDSWAKSIHEVLMDIALEYAQSIALWMQQNASWIDQTGEARASLFAEVENLVTQISIEIGGTADHIKYLEFAHGGRYAIIGPALDYWYPQVLAAVEAVFGS